MCNEDDKQETSQEININEITDDERKKYEEWMEIIQEIRMKIDL